MISIDKKDKEKIPFLYILISVVILINSGYYRSTFLDSYLPFFLLILTTGFVLIKNRTILLRKNNCWICLIVGLVISTLANFEANNLMSFGRVLVTAMSVYLIMCCTENRSLLQALVTTAKASFIIALVFYFIIRGFGINIPNMMGNHYDLIIYTGVPASSRLMGMFWEPGVLSSIALITCLLEYYVLCNRIKVLDFVIYTFTIVLTMSPAGILIYLIVLAGCLFKDEQKIQVKVLGCIFLILLAVISVYSEELVRILTNINPAIFGKLAETNSSSYATRFSIPLINFESFLQRPIVGYGFTGSASLITQKTSSLHNIVAQTSTSTQFLSAIGICGIAYSVGFLYPIFDKRLFQHLCIEKKIVIAIVMLLIVNKEPHIFICMSWIIFMCCTMENNISVE